MKVTINIFGGTMIIEMRTYTIKPGRLHDFIKIYNEDIRETHIKILGNQLGFFYSEFGELNQVVHLYGYDSYNDRDKRRKILSKNEDFKNYVKKAASLIFTQTSQLLIPAEFSKIK